MEMMERLDAWTKQGLITEEQHQTFTALVRKQRISLFVELNALLYLGVLSIAAGIGWTIKTYFANLGDVLILLSLSVLLVGSLYYCFRNGGEFSQDEVDSPSLVFDYILYFACLVLSVELGYIEFRFELLREVWDGYLLASAAVFFFLAYRFDNRFVLSLALSALAGWFGLRFNRAGFLSAETLSVTGLVYGGLVAAGGVFLYWRGVKKHFLETYLHIAANVIFVSTLSGVGASSRLVPYVLLLLALAAAAVILGIHFKRFAFVAYGIAYGYIGISLEILSGWDFKSSLAYTIVTGSIVVISIVLLARRFGREE
jgi:hypothetical protein